MASTECTPRIKDGPPPLVAPLDERGADARLSHWQDRLLPFMLEQELISRRYKQVNSVILARVWTRYLGFLTGMTLALVGAFFVLGQLRTDPSALQAEGPGLKASLTTSSPGLVLATLGSVLMGISLIVAFEFDTRDVPTYVQPQQHQPGAPVVLPPPTPMPKGSGMAPGGKTKADSLAEEAPSPGGEQSGAMAPKK